jgi:hypothetical protein
VCHEPCQLVTNVERGPQAYHGESIDEIPDLDQFVPHQDELGPPIRLKEATSFETAHPCISSGDHKMVAPPCSSIASAGNGLVKEYRWPYIGSQNLVISLLLSRRSMALRPSSI